MEEYNIIGKEIFFGRIKEEVFENEETIFRLEILEGKVKDVICFDAFSPKEIIIDGKEYFVPISMDDYYLLCDDEKEIGYHICDMSREKLLKRLCNRYNALMLADSTLEWLMDNEHCFNIDNESLPEVYTLKNGEYVKTEDDIFKMINDSDRYGKNKA